MAAGPMLSRCDWYLAVYVGTDELGYTQDPNAGRVECRAWDMLRYDRCYPASNAERFEKMGFLLFKQPYQKDIRGGFTTARWESFGFRDYLVAPATPNGSIPFSLEENCREFAQQRVLRKREKARGNHG